MFTYFHCARSLLKFVYKKLKYKVLPSKTKIVTMHDMLDMLLQSQPALVCPFIGVWILQPQNATAGRAHDPLHFASSTLLSQTQLGNQIVHSLGERRTVGSKAATARVTSTKKAILAENSLIHNHYGSPQSAMRANHHNPATLSLPRSKAYGHRRRSRRPPPPSSISV